MQAQWSKSHLTTLQVLVNASCRAEGKPSTPPMRMIDLGLPASDCTGDLEIKAAPSDNWTRLVRTLPGQEQAPAPQ